MSGAARNRQFDLFGAPAADPADVELTPRAALPAQAGQSNSPFSSPHDNETLAAHLEASGNYRVLRKLEPRPIVEGWNPETCRPDEKIGIVLDTETTGLDHRVDEIIELGMVMFTYGEDGIHDVVGVFDELREPDKPIAPEIIRITGITDAMVAGKAIDPEMVSSFIEPADIVIAHNAKFDRPFCEHFAPGFDIKPWACSNDEVDWRSLGFEGSKLGYLVGQCGWFHHGHRAIDDCHALLEVLAFQHEAAGSAFPHLMASADRRRCRIWAENSPFDLKDVLKARGYRWNDGSDGRPKSWWTEVEEDQFEDECRFLRQEIYRGDIEPHAEWLTAVERYKA